MGQRTWEYSFLSFSCLLLSEETMLRMMIAVWLTGWLLRCFLRLAFPSEALAWRLIPLSFLYLLSRSSSSSSSSLCFIFFGSKSLCSWGEKRKKGTRNDEEEKNIERQPKETVETASVLRVFWRFCLFVVLQKEAVYFCLTSFLLFFSLSFGWYSSQRKNSWEKTHKYNKNTIAKALVFYLWLCMEARANTILPLPQYDIIEREECLSSLFIWSYKIERKVRYGLSADLERLMLSLLPGLSFLFLVLCNIIDYHRKEVQAETKVSLHLN